MNKVRKLLAAFLVLVLILPLTSVNYGFAAPDNGPEQAITEDTIDEDVGEDAGTYPEDGFVEPTEDTKDGVLVDSADVIEYVYLDEKIVTLGQDQYVAFALLDETAVITRAEISFLKTDTGEIRTFFASVMVDNTALFTILFSEDEDVTGYSLVEITYGIAGVDEVYRVEFSAQSDEQEGVYFFDVVTPQLAEVLFKEPGKDGDVIAFTITDDGEFVAADDFEDALAIAGTEGIEEGVVDESFADQEALSIEEQSEKPGISGPAQLIPLVSELIAPLGASTAREDYLVVALDPGHGGGDPGSSGNGLIEKDLNWKIAVACRDELLKYTGVSPMLTRTESENPSLQERVNRAVAYGADVFVSIHNNSTETPSPTATGSEVWIPNSASYLKNETHVVGEQLGNKILAQLAALGLTNRGVKERDNTTNEKYPDGSLADYYTVINESRRAGIPGIIVEHAFVTNATDADKLKDDAFLVSLGKADAIGIVQQYNLITDASAQSIAWVKYQSHVSKLGWQAYVYDQKVSGTVGKSLGIEGFNIQLKNQPTTGSIQYNSYVTGVGWQGWKDSGVTSGTTGLSTTIQAMQIRLTGDMANKYDVYYRVYSANFGWLGWAKNGASAGSVNYGYNEEAFEVVIVMKGVAAPGSTDTPFKDKASAPKTSVVYEAHVASIGWQSQVADGATAGTTGRSLRVEAFKISLKNQEYTGSIEYNTHCAGIGWQGWKSNGAIAGTTGQSRQVEAIQIRLTGEIANRYDVYYRAHSATFGWMGWAKNGGSAGTTGYAYRMEAIEIRLVEKGGAAPGTTNGACKQKILVLYEAHVASIGWQDQVADGVTAGTTGRSLRIEALKVLLYAQQYPGSIEYNAHCAYLGWQGWKSNGAVAGTVGQSRQVEAIQIRLTGEMANRYDVYYRAHSATFGWLGWAKNGESAGTAGYSYRMEALEIRLVEKSGAAPGSTSGAFKEKGVVSGTQIMGSTSTSVAQMARRYNATGNTYPVSTYSSKGAANITAFCQIIWEEAIAEGVKPEVVFCQAMKETGWLRFGGEVNVSQCNFCGLRPTNGVGFATFSNVREGIRAQVQHLKCYASTASLNNPLVDPRWNVVVSLYGRGSSPTVESLSGTWATDPNYGTSLVSMINDLYKA